MLVRSLVVAACLLVITPALAQGPGSRSAQNALNWDIFLKLYPSRAIAAREEGAVGFKVTLDNKGEVVGCQVTHSSGHPLLDNETCQLITLHAQFTPDPNLSPSQTKTHDGLIAWKLPASVTALAPPKPIAPAAAPEKMICKKVLRAGTLADHERTCMTPTEWAKQSDEMKQPFADVQGRKGSSSGVSCINPSGC